MHAHCAGLRSDTMKKQLKAELKPHTEALNKVRAELQTALDLAKVSWP